MTYFFGTGYGSESLFAIGSCIVTKVCLVIVIDMSHFPTGSSNSYKSSGIEKKPFLATIVSAMKSENYFVKFHSMKDF